MKKASASWTRRRGLRTALWLTAFLVLGCSLSSLVLVRICLDRSLRETPLRGNTPISYFDRAQSQLARFAHFRAHAPVSANLMTQELKHLDTEVVIATANAPPSDNITDSDNTVLQGAGIVICLHDGILAMGVSLIKELRCLGNREPIQVYHCFPGELSQRSRELLIKVDPHIQIIDVCSELVERKVLAQKIAETFQSYWIKPLALRHTTFTHVLMLDADVLLMQNPGMIRQLPGYTQSGTTFFYDRVVNKHVNFNKRIQLERGKGNAPKVRYLDAWVQKFPYERFNLTGPEPSTHFQSSPAYRGQSCHEQDSSMVAIDKARGGKALDVLWYMVTEKRFKFRFSWGDKEAFWLSWGFNHMPYFFSPWGVSALESSVQDDFQNHESTLCGNMAHYVPAYAPEAELLYVNSRSLLEAYPKGKKKALNCKRQQHSDVFNFNPKYVSPRRTRQPQQQSKQHQQHPECLTGLGATKLPAVFFQRLLVRRAHMFAVETEFFEPLEHCNIVS
ncbi:hypothetical protein FI667_g4882, partial [Globisporangium splendens]